MLQIRIAVADLGEGGGGGFRFLFPLTRDLSSRVDLHAIKIFVLQFHTKKAYHTTLCIGSIKKMLILPYIKTLWLAFFQLFSFQKSIVKGFK